MTKNANIVRDDIADDQGLSLGADAVIGTTAPKKGGGPKNKATGLPVEYQDKTPEELVAILQAKESMIGRQSQEIGHLRDLSDQLLKSQASMAATVTRSSPQEAEVQVSSDEILEKPVEAIRKVVAPLINSAVGEIKQTLAGVAGSTAQAEFARKHPTYQQDMVNPEFQKFVQASPYRLKLATNARQNADFDAAEELWSAWEEHSKASADAGDDDDLQEQQDNLRNAVTVRAGNGGADAGQAKPIYSAAKLQQMRNTNPDEYYSPAFQKKILQAFRERRVR